jgi:hypothetical protein
MDINGLPLHPLVVHAAVVLGPVSALAGLGYALVPRWRAWLRWPFAVVVVLAGVAIWVAFLTGESFRDSADFFTQGELGEKIEVHEELAEKLRLAMTAFTVVGVAATVLHSRSGAVRVALSALVVVGALGVAVLTVLTGDAGAQAVYGS